MPVLVNHTRCNCAPTCFAANACPYDALHVDRSILKVWSEPDKCGTCPGPCLNFCDAVALKYAPTLEELEIVRQELEGTMTAEQAAEARAAMMEQMKAKAAEEEAKKEVAAAIVTLTSDNFMEEVANSPIPVMVDFWAEWCGPCKQIAPIMTDLAKEFSGKVKFAKLNIDEEPQIAGQLGIQSIPTLIIFYGGRGVDVIVGAQSKEVFRSRIQRVVTALEKAMQEQQALQQPQPAPAPPTTNAEKAPPNPVSGAARKAASLLRPNMLPPRGNRPPKR